MPEKVFCSQCTRYSEVYSPQPGESWDRCSIKLDKDESQYCGNLNSKNNCTYYIGKMILFKRHKPEWWRSYY